MGKEAVSNLKKATEVTNRTWKDMPPEYQDAYKNMADAWEKFRDDLLNNAGSLSIFTTWLQSYTLHSVLAHGRKYKTRIPSCIAKMEEEKQAELIESSVKSMIRMTRMMRAEVENDWTSSWLDNYKKLSQIDDLRALMLESRGWAKTGIKLLGLSAKLDERSAEEKLLRSIFGGNEKKDEKAREMIKSYLEDTIRYFGALEDFSDSEENLPDEYYARIEETLQMYNAVNILVNAQMAMRIPEKRSPKSLDEIARNMAGLMQLARLEELAKDGANVPDLRNIVPHTKEFLDAVDELEEIRENPDNFTGFHVNHIISGKSVFCLMKETSDENEIGYQSLGEFASREEAEKTANKIARETGDKVVVYESPSDEYYTLIRNADDTLASCCLFDSEAIAYAALYLFAKPKCYLAFRESLKQAAEKKSV